MTSENNFIPWPDGLPLAYNGSNEPCDMLVGPCSCGAWHNTALPEFSYTVKQLEWEPPEFTVYPIHVTKDMGNQVMYFIRVGYDYDLNIVIYQLELYYGYVTNPERVGHYFTVDDAKSAAQKHFHKSVFELFFQ